MPRRDQHILLGLTALSVLLALLVSLTGINADVLLATPALILLLPLLAGRYVGEEGIARLGARLVAPRRGASCPWPPRPVARTARAAPRRTAHRRGPGPSRAARDRVRDRALGGRSPAGAPSAVRRPRPARSLFACPASRAVLAASALIALMAAPAASAHEGNVNYRSVIRTVSPDVSGLRLDVLNRDDRLELQNTTAAHDRRRRLRGRALRAAEGRRHRRGQPPLARLLPQRRALRGRRRSPRRPTRRPRRSGSSSTAPAASSGMTTASTG